MATEAAPNGSYATQQGYGSTEQGFSGTSASGSSTQQSADIPKDEVGWYFVEQYYTTLSRSPEKLFLFYQKRSQFISGTEEEKVPINVGQKAINDRIKELDYVDCKVRITNVDSQGSDNHIVIQVIGELSNKQQPHKKFAQTFILATQTNGYFVLNDIFRYIADEDVEPVGDETAQGEGAGSLEPVPTAADADAGTLANSADAGSREADATKVDKSLEEAIQHEEVEVAPPPAAVNGDSVSATSAVDVAEDAPAGAPAPEVKSSEDAAQAALEEEIKLPEKPKDPEPTRAAPTPKASPAPAAAPSKPAAPKTWASLAASANKVAMPQISAPAPVATPNAAPKASPAQAPAASAPTAPAAAPVAPAAQAPRDSSPANSGAESASGWQTADHGKRASRVIGQPPQVEETNTRAYIKNVYESVKEEDLRAALTKFGEITYLDISRPKNCAFVDFASRAAFTAAVAGNPHKIGDDSIFVEERRVRNNNGPAFGNFPRGGGPQRGRGDGRPSGQGRGGFKPDGGRGNFTPRGRGGASTPRGRGGSQAA